MGRATIILIIGLSVITSFLILSLNANSKEGLRTTVDHYENTQARLIANSGIEMYLEKMRGDKTLKGSYNNNSLLDGSYDINIAGTDSLGIVTSVGHFGNTVHQTIVKVSREPVDMPPFKGALHIVSDVLGLKLNGNLDIDGNDTNIDGSPGPEPSLPGVVLDEPSDSAYFIDNIKPKIAKDIEGFGGSPSVYSDAEVVD